MVAERMSDDWDYIQQKDDNNVKSFAIGLFIGMMAMYLIQYGLH